MGSQKVLKYLGTAQTLTSLAQSKARVWGPTSGRWERCCQTSPCPEMAQEQENQDPNSRDSQGDCRSTARPQVLSLLQKHQLSPKWAGIHPFGPYPRRCCCTGGMFISIVEVVGPASPLLSPEWRNQTKIPINPSLLWWEISRSHGGFFWCPRSASPTPVPLGISTVIGLWNHRIS